MVDKNSFKISLKRIITILLVNILLIFNATDVYASYRQPVAFGIDVSKYQDDIDWYTVKNNSNVSFAIIKCGSFNSGVDSHFYDNVNGCIENNIKFGIYIYSYATTVDEAIDEAFYVVNLIKGYPVSYPICYDIEDICQLNLSSLEKQNLINAFCSTIKNLGYHPLIYSSKHWLEKKIVTIDWDVWVAQFNSECSYDGDYKIWQNSSHEMINGIPKCVDTNFQYERFDDYILKDGLYKSGEYCFCRKDYIIQYGLFDYDGEIYYTDDMGHLQGGVVDIGNSQLFFDPNTFELLPSRTINYERCIYITDDCGKIIYQKPY